MFCGFLAVTAAAVPRMTVRVKASSVASGERLTLGELAEVTGSPSQIEKLRSIALGYSPEVGAVREISRQKIALAISAAGFSLADVQLVAPEIARVKRETQQIDPEIIRAAVSRALLAGLEAEGATTRVSRLDLPSRFEAPAGQISAEASVGGARNLFTPFLISIELRVDGRVFRRFSTTAQIEAFASVMVATHDLPVKTRLRESDYKVELRRLDRDSAVYLRNSSRLRGVSLSRPVRQDDPITTDLLVREQVVEPGDVVRIIGESGLLKIIVQGEARGAGRVGDRIQVKNLQSGVLLQAVVVDEGVVSVRF